MNSFPPRPSPATSSRRHSFTRLRSPLLPALLAAIGIIAACSSPPSAESQSAAPRTDPIGSSQAAYSVQNESGTFAKNDLSTVLGAVNFWGSSLAFAPPANDFSSGQLDFISATCGFGQYHLSSYFPGGTLTLPTDVVTTGGPCGTYTVSFTGLSTSAFTGTTPFGGTPGACGPLGGTSSGSATLTPNGLVITVPVAASLHLAAGTGGQNFCPSANVALPSGTLTVTLAWQSVTQTFTANVVSKMQYNVVGNSCLGGLCDSIIGGKLGELNSELGTAATTALNTALSSGSVATSVSTGLYTMLGSDWNLLHQGDQGGGVPWAVVPGTVVYDTTNSQFTFNVTRDAAPRAQCSFSATCAGNVQVGCTMDGVVNPSTGLNPPDPIAIYAAINGQQQLVTTLSNPISPSSTQTYATFIPPNGATTFQGCTLFPGGPACGAPTTVVFNPPSCAPPPPPPPCVPATTCSELPSQGWTPCGVWSDGCGGKIDCGTSCPSGEYCDNKSFNHSNTCVPVCDLACQQAQCEDSGGAWYNPLGASHTGTCKHIKCKGASCQ